MVEKQKRLWLTVFFLLFSVISSCRGDAGVELVPVLPRDEPNLLKEAGVRSLVFQPVRSDTGEVADPVEVLRGESLRLSGLDRGSWKIQVTGYTEGGDDVVYGEVPPFYLEPGRGEKVHFFLGRAFAFNLVALDPPEVAKHLIDLRYHTVTAYEGEDGKTRFLVAGGAYGETAANQALVVNPGDFSLELIPGGMGCGRSSHSAFRVKTREGERIVLAGGDGDCPGTFDIFDPKKGEFHTLSSPCSGSTTAGAVPEVTPVGRDFIQSGRVIVPGNPMCVVDILSGEGEEYPVLEGDTPEEPRASAVNGSGFVAILARDGLFLDTAYGRSTCSVLGDIPRWKGDALWRNAPISNKARIHTLRSGRFLLLGGAHQADSGYVSVGWAIATPEECEWGSVTAGPWGEHMPEDGFAPFELDFGVGLDDLYVLLTGGFVGENRQVTDAVHLLRGPISRVAPSWHGMSKPNVIRYPLHLRTPRGGHGLVKVDDGNTWILGGGAEPAEIFVQGPRGKSRVEPVDNWLFSRSPSYISMAVLDRTQDGQNLSKAFVNIYPAALFGRINPGSALFLFGSSDRGIGDHLMDKADGGAAPPCDPIATGIPSEIAVISKGPSDEEIVVIGPGGEPIPVPGGKKTLEVARDTMGDFLEKTTSLCPWRQPLRVGLDALDYGGLPDPGVRPESRRRAVHVLAIVTAGDDCSQGIYDGEGGPSPDSPEILHNCSDTSYDEYFGLPPTGESRLTAFKGILDGLVEDLDDLHLIIVGGLGAPPKGSCSLDEQIVALAGGTVPTTVFRPDRLLRVAEEMEKLGARIYNVDICDDGESEKNPLEVSLGRQIEDMWAASDYLEACVPDSVFDAGWDEAVQGEVEENIESRCRVLARTSVSFDVGGVFPVYGRKFEYVIPLQRGRAGWSVRKGHLRDTTCASQWLVYVPPGDILSGTKIEDVAIICID